MDVLVVKNQSNLARLIKAVRDAAKQFGESDGLQSLDDVAELWAEAGDMTAAFQTVDLIPNSLKGYALRAIAIVQAKAAYIAEAQKTANLVPEDAGNNKSWTQTEIVRAQVEAGDIAGAAKTLDLIQSDTYKDGARKLVAQAQVKAGHMCRRSKER